MQTIQTLLQHNRGKTQLQLCLGLCSLCTEKTVGHSVLWQKLKTCCMMLSHSSDHERAILSSFAFCFSHFTDVKGTASKTVFQLKSRKQKPHIGTAITKAKQYVKLCCYWWGILPDYTLLLYGNHNDNEGASQKHKQRNKHHAEHPFLHRVS